MLATSPAMSKVQIARLAGPMIVLNPVWSQNRHGKTDCHLGQDQHHNQWPMRMLQPQSGLIAWARIWWNRLSTDVCGRGLRVA